MTNSYFEKRKILNSEKAEAGAINLIQKISENKLVMDCLPNTYPKFKGELEEQDFLSYCAFIKSWNGNMILNMLEEEDAGQYIEL